MGFANAGQSILAAAVLAGGGKLWRNLSRSTSDHAKLCQVRLHDRCSLDHEDS